MHEAIESHIEFLREVGEAVPELIDFIGTATVAVSTIQRARLCFIVLTAR